VKTGGEASNINGLAGTGKWKGSEVVYHEVVETNEREEGEREGEETVSWH
jgi:hypothetical protein